MKKLFILMAMLLCISALLVSCNNDDYIDEEETKPQDNVEDNIAMIVSELNKYETLDELVKNETATYDYEKLAEELNKMSEQAICSLNLTQDGKKLGSANSEAIMKNNEFYVKATADGESVGVNASITDNYALAYAVWNQDSKGNVKVTDSMAIDLKAYFEELEVYYGNYVFVNAGDMPIDPKELKMPTITAEQIIYEDGKYSLDNDFLYDAFMTTLEAVIDEMKNNGEELPEDFDEQYEEIKKEGKKILDAIDFELYFLAKLEKVEGMGMSLSMDASRISDVFDIDKSELGDMEHVKIAYEVSTKSVNLEVEYQEKNGPLNMLSVDYDYIYKGKKLCGYTLKYELENTSKTVEESRNDSDYGYDYHKNLSESVDKQSIEIMFDFSNFEKSDATVFDFNASIESKSNTSYEYGNEGGVVDSNISETESKTRLDMSVKTIQAHKANVNMDMSVNQSAINNGEKSKNETTMSIDGTMEVITEGVKLPTINEDVKAAMEKALKNPVNPFK